MKNVLQRTLILNRWPQYASNERWDNCLARTEDLIPHDRHHVTYICDAVGRLGVPDTAHEVHLVRDFADTAAIHELVADLVRKKGAFQHLFAFSENLLDLAATLRASHAIPGPGPDDVVVDRAPDFRRQIALPATFFSHPWGFAPRTPRQRRSLAASPLAPLRWLARDARSRVANAMTIHEIGCSGW